MNRLVFACFGLLLASCSHAARGGAGEEDQEAARRQISAAPIVAVQVEKNLHWRGATAPVLTVVEFSDIECPHCRTLAWARDTFLSKHADEVRWYFRHFPLSSSCNRSATVPLHPNACFAARAAEAAANQGKFWEFLGAVFRRGDDLNRGGDQPIDLSDGALERHARNVGLDIERWKKDEESPEIVAQVTRDIDAGISLGVSAVPTLVVNGRLIVGGAGADALDEWLAMAKRGELAPRSVESR